MIVLALALAFNLTQPISDTQAISRTLVVMFEAGGQQVTEVSRAYAVDDVQEAVNWWHDLSPIPLHLTVAQTVPTTTFTSDIIPLYITSGLESYTDRRSIWIGDNGPFRSAVVAHELGHVLFGLPDWYLQSGACEFIDVMCEPVSAYYSRIIGCRSRNVIVPGSCTVRGTYLPIVLSAVQQQKQ